MHVASLPIQLQWFPVARHVKSSVLWPQNASVRTHLPVGLPLLLPVPKLNAFSSPTVLKTSSLTIALTLLLLFSSTEMASLLPTVQQIEKEIGHCMDAGRISVLLPQKSCQLGQVIKQSCLKILIENEDHNSFLALWRLKEIYMYSSHPVIVLCWVSSLYL